jgi:ribosomal 50S subunit-recycling heat shock protein
MGQALPEKPGGAILHTQGGVWVNGYEAHDSSAVFPGDVIETKPDSSANLSLDGSTVLIAPESVSKFQADLLELDHGGVSVVTSKSFKVRVNCILVVPVRNDWTEYVVTDLNGTVQVAARKLDVNVEHEHGRGKEVTESQPSQEPASVHEGEQKSYEESKVCGPGARPTSSWGGISPKWIAAGAAGAGILIWLLIHGGNPKPQISPATP